MPYRRLPETDQARYTVLKKAVEGIASQRTLNTPIVEYATYVKAQNLYNKLSNTLDQFRSQFQGRIDNSKKYRLAGKNVKMFLSHFIKIIQMSVQRGELSPDILKMYHLPLNEKDGLSLKRDKDILEIGNNIIDGEMKRISQGGFPIYYPNINKVKVHYELFKEAYMNNEFHKQNLQRLNALLETLRKEIDDFLPILWNQIERNFVHLPTKERIAKGQQFGIIYYYRKDEDASNNRLYNIFSDIPILEEV